MVGRLETRLYALSGPPASRRDLARSEAAAWLARGIPGVVGCGLAAVGIARRSPTGALLAVAGVGLAYGGLAGKAPLPAWLRGRIPATSAAGRLVARRAITIQRPLPEVYAVWRDFEQLPRFMGYLQSVKVGEDGRSHWVASGPAGSRLEWDAQVIEERRDELLRWRSLPGAQVANRGEVRFQRAPADRGTEVRLWLEYEPPAGAVGAKLAQVLGQGADRQVRESLRNFKQLMEAGEIPTNDGQPKGSCRASR